MKYQVKSSSAERGQGLVEYALILVLVAVVVIVILALLGPSIRTVFAQVNCEFNTECKVCKADANQCMANMNEEWQSWDFRFTVLLP